MRLGCGFGKHLPVKPDCARPRACPYACNVEGEHGGCGLGNLFHPLLSGCVRVHTVITEVIVKVPLLVSPLGGELPDPPALLCMAGSNREEPRWSIG